MSGTPNLTAALCAAMAEATGVWKDDEHGKQGYSFTSVDEVRRVVRPLLAKHGLHVGAPEQLRLIEAGGKKNGVAAVAKMVYVLKHTSGEEREYRWDWVVQEPWKGTDITKTQGAAVSYAKKYFLLDLLELDRYEDGSEEDFDRQAQGEKKKQGSQRTGKASDSSRKEAKTTVSKQELSRAADLLVTFSKRYDLELKTIPKWLNEEVGRDILDEKNGRWITPIYQAEWDKMTETLRRFEKSVVTEKQEMDSYEDGGGRHAKSAPGPETDARAGTRMAPAEERAAAKEAIDHEEVEAKARAALQRLDDDEIPF